MRQILVAVLLVVAGATVIAAQGEYRCESPKDWYAKIFEFNPTERRERRGNFYYDEAESRIAIVEEEREGDNSTSYYHEIYLHDMKLGYSINLQTKECRKFILNEPFPVIGVYLSDSYQGEAYIGSSDEPKDGVRVQLYSGANERGHFYGVWIPMEEEVCVPVSETYNRISDRSSSTRRYYDVRLGIHDPDVFIPPSNC